MIQRVKFLGPDYFPFNGDQNLRMEQSSGDRIRVHLGFSLLLCDTVWC